MRDENCLVSCHLVCDRSYSCVPDSLFDLAGVSHSSLVVSVPIFVFRWLRDLGLGCPSFLLCLLQLCSSKSVSSFVICCRRRRMLLFKYLCHLLCCCVRYRCVLLPKYFSFIVSHCRRRQLHRQLLTPSSCALIQKFPILVLMS